MRIDFRVATGMGMLALLAVGGLARDARQQPSASSATSTSSSASPATQPKTGSTATASPAKAGGAPSVLPDAAPLSPAAANRKAWKCLDDGLAEKNYDRRAQAIAAVGTIGLQRTAVSLVEQGLSDKDVPVRQTAADVLGTMKSRASIPKLQAALDDDSVIVGFAAAQALWTMGDKSGQGLFLEVLEGDRNVSTGLVRGGLQQVHEKIHDRTALAELGAVEAAGAFLGPGGFGVTAAIELTKDKAAPARAISARLLAVDTSAQGRDVLREALQDKSWIVRAAAAEALGVHGSVNDLAMLAPMLDDPQKEVRYRAAAAIIRVTSRRAA